MYDVGRADGREAGRHDEQANRTGTRAIEGPGQGDEAVEPEPVLPVDGVRGDPGWVLGHPEEVEHHNGVVPTPSQILEKLGVGQAVREVDGVVELPELGEARARSDAGDDLARERQLLCQGIAEAAAVAEQQVPRRLGARHARRGLAHRLFPDGSVQPLGDVRRRRQRARGPVLVGIDPRALGVEGIGRQPDTLGALLLVERRPLGIHAGGEELSEGAGDHLVLVRPRGPAAIW